MLKMAQIEYIKFLYEVEGKSLTSIAKELNVNFRTVKKYAEEYNWSPDLKQRRKRQHPALGPYIDIIDNWLLDDLKRPRKQRHTAVRIYNRLVEEHGFDRGKRTVAAYVSKKKKELKQSKEGYLPLEHIPGEAQLDFGEMAYINVASEEKKAYYLTLSFPYSNAAFTQIFEAQNQECVIEGLQRIFQYIGGVPTVIVMDNMKSVVSKILPEGEREITEGFKRFALHYRFNMRFCNPASGNEKGNVENKIGYHRRNWFVPVPQIDNLEEYNATLWAKAEKDMERQHYLKSETLMQLWEKDKAKLLYLAEYEYDGFSYEEARINKYGCIQIDENRYSVSPELVGEKVSVKKYYNKIEIYKDKTLIAEFQRCYGKNKEIFDWKQYLRLMSFKSGAIEHTKFYDQIPKLWREHLLKIEKKEKKKVLLLLKEAIEKDDLEQIDTAFELSRLYGKTDTDSIRQCYYNLTLNSNYMPPCNIAAEVPALNYEPTLNPYDHLLGKEVVQ